MVLDLPQRVPGLAGKTSLYAEVRLPCPSQYLSNRLAGGHTDTCCEQKQMNTLTDQTTHLVKGRIIHQQFPVWPTYLKKSIECNFKYGNKKQMRQKWEIQNPRILQLPHSTNWVYLHTHFVTAFFTWLTCNQKSLSAEHRYIVFNKRKYTLIALTSIPAWRKLQPS